MIRIKNQELRIKPLKNIAFIALFLILTASFSTPASAAESSPSAATKSKFELLREEIASRAAQYIPEMNKKLNNKAYTGIIKTLSANSITISTTAGEKNIALNEFTDYIWKNKSSNLKSLAAGNFIAGLGDIDDKETLLTKRVVRLEQPTEKEFIFGTVSTVNSGKITLQTKDKKDLTLVTNTNTDYLTAKGKELTFKDIKVDQTVIAVGIKNGETLQVQLIYLPVSALSLKTKVSTDSATPAASSEVKKRI